MRVLKTSEIVLISGASNNGFWTAVGRYAGKCYGYYMNNIENSVKNGTFGYGIFGG
ncbi:hypothetical protein [Mixta intestinalis]|jgi:hypothetical protein|uniref:Uncharacterized protein n=1 Tax=Mixta intestinalis TaxID=1615494 RepID=A0A6P1PWX6_9GAMM|nr:hypothetical protein [Mixta intestinalis]QHM71036.1 hypothetical protein C7M51_01318 [Mixta intestinalis]